MSRTRNPLLTDAECDAIKDTPGVHVDISDVYEVSGVMWRRSQHESYAEALSARALYSMELCYGCTSALDSLTNMRRVAAMLDREADEDIRIILTIDGVCMPECVLHEADDQITRYLIRRGSYGNFKSR